MCAVGSPSSMQIKETPHALATQGQSTFKMGPFFLILHCMLKILPTKQDFLLALIFTLRPLNLPLQNDLLCCISINEYFTMAWKISTRALDYGFGAEKQYRH